MGVEAFVIYNSVGFIEATSNRMKRKYEAQLKMLGYKTFNLRIKKPYVVNVPMVITTPRGVIAILEDKLTDRDLNTISQMEKQYFSSQREVEEYLSALATARGMVLTIANRPTTLYLLSIAEKYGFKIPANVHEHKPVLHIAPLREVSEELAKKVGMEYDAMLRGEDTGGPLTEFYYDKQKKLIVSRRLKRLSSDNVFFENGNGIGWEILKERFGEKISTGIMKWITMR